MVEGGCLLDVLGVNYFLVRGFYDFEYYEIFGR